ncbi:hypothetical protein CEXT_805211 [Caerostris extrusa]|uniref:Uncharacterized protein n=1 Tax=Caerostris extrusa TaxID=172846 RepID=A0AAV4XWR3_CAEEX|nr:hypothetical protein CEXT_805211 [Caerostris extrusa]
MFSYNFLFLFVHHFNYTAVIENNVAQIQAKIPFFNAPTEIGDEFYVCHVQNKLRWQKKDCKCRSDIFVEVKARFRFFFSSALHCLLRRSKMYRKPFRRDEELYLECRLNSETSNNIPKGTPPPPLSRDPWGKRATDWDRRTKFPPRDHWNKGFPNENRCRNNANRQLGLASGKEAIPLQFRKEALNGVANSPGRSVREIFSNVKVIYGGNLSGKACFFPKIFLLSL